MITVNRIVSPYLSSNMYVLSQGERSIIIDPCDTGEALAAGGNADFIFLTHEHFDHISGAKLLAEQTGAPVLCGELCAERLGDPVLNGSHHFNAFAILRGQPCEVKVGDFCCTADRTIHHGETLSWQGHTVTFLYTPGHLDSCFSLLLDSMLFTGDAVLLDKDGLLAKCDPHYADLFRELTIPLLKQLPANTMIYPGHGTPFLLKHISPEDGLFGRI